MTQDRMLPNAALRTLFMAIEEVMGSNGMRAMLKASGLERFIDNYPPNNTALESRFADYGAAEQAVEDFYGARGARAILTRIGRATFQYTLREQPAILGLAGLAIKALPMGMRMKLVLERVAKAANEDVNQPAHLREERDAYYFVVEECPCRWRPRHTAPACFVTVGVLQEAMHWATGKNFRIEEVACISNGAKACVYRIPKQPIE
ncbi:MAG: V4R domain-containing protein [Anaerolineae bacterium]